MANKARGSDNNSNPAVPCPRETHMLRLSDTTDTGQFARLVRRSRVSATPHINGPAGRPAAASTAARPASQNRPPEEPPCPGGAGHAAPCSPAPPGPATSCDPPQGRRSHQPDLPAVNSRPAIASSLRRPTPPPDGGDDEDAPRYHVQGVAVAGRARGRGRQKRSPAPPAPGRETHWTTAPAAARSGRRQNKPLPRAIGHGDRETGPRRSGKPTERRSTRPPHQPPHTQQDITMRLPGRARRGRKAGEQYPNASQTKWTGQSVEGDQHQHNGGNSPHQPGRPHSAPASAPR